MEVYDFTKELKVFCDKFLRKEYTDKEYMLKEIKYPEWKQNDYLYYSGMIKFYRPKIILVNARFEIEDEVVIIVDKNINEILNCYGFNFEFSNEFIEKL